MAKYTISFSTTVTTTRVIEATSEDHALEIAGGLRFNEEFFGGIIDSWDHNYDAYRAKYCTVELEGEADDDEEADW